MNDSERNWQHVIVQISGQCPWVLSHSLQYFAQAMESVCLVTQLEYGSIGMILIYFHLFNFGDASLLGWLD